MSVGDYEYQAHQVLALDSYNIQLKVVEGWFCKRLTISLRLNGCPARIQEGNRDILE